jgi:hypothetical protein
MAEAGPPFGTGDAWDRRMTAALDLEVDLEEDGEITFGLWVWSGLAIP